MGCSSTASSGSAQLGCFYSQPCRSLWSCGQGAADLGEGDSSPGPPCGLWDVPLPHPWARRGTTRPIGQHAKAFQHWKGWLWMQHKTSQKGRLGPQLLQATLSDLALSITCGEKHPWLLARCPQQHHHLISGKKRKLSLLPGCLLPSASLNLFWKAWWEESKGLHMLQDIF